jgi:hypothetical protein
MKEQFLEYLESEKIDVPKPNYNGFRSNLAARYREKYISMAKEMAKCGISDQDLMKLQNRRSRDFFTDFIVNADLTNTEEICVAMLDALKLQMGEKFVHNGEGFEKLRAEQIRDEKMEPVV